MIYRITKSKFILGLQCEKALYLDVYKPQLAYFPPETLARFRKGRDFEAKIKALFPNAIDVSQHCGRNIPKYPELTAQILGQQGEINLYEAGFVYNEVLVLADVVHKDADGNISVYEIKNSLSVKDVFRRDVCIQHYVISHCADISSFSIIYNDGEDNPKYEELLSEAREAEPLIARQVERFKEVLQGMEPQIKTGTQCAVPYECPYKRYCEGKVATQLELTDF
ncbi:MAG: hypothetical protein J6T88_01350 [Bacteroidales bacterium]|nr:hypothetical protein [Bacteroidales bacterium]